MARKITDAERAEALESLHKLLKPQDTVFTILRHASSSGMSRVIDLVIPTTTEKRFNVYKPTLAQIRRAGADELYVAAPADLGWEAARAREDVGQAVLVSLDGDTARVRFNYGRNAGQESEVARRRLYVVETRMVPSLRSIGWLAAKAMGDTFDSDRQGIKANGCGMDMGFALVYNLGRTLWPNGTGVPHGSRNGESATDGGYALKHSWL